jgi:tetratricopeptide (TPR) repeat protein
MLRLLSLAFAYALLIGCATSSPVAEKDTPSESAANDDEAASVPEKPFPADSFYDLLVAEFALRRQEYDVTLEMYTKQAPLLRDPAVSAHTTHLAQFMQRENEAMKSAQLWVELEPDNSEANSTMASLLSQQGKTLAALPYLEMVQRQTGEANFPLLLSGFTQLSEQDRTELVQGINRLATQYPKNSSLLLTQALIYAEFGQYDAALDNLDTILVLEPEQPQAILLEAKILVEQGSDNAYVRLQRVLQDNPDAKRLRLQYARMLTTTDIPAAREQFEFLSAESPRDGDLLFSLALINHEMGDSDAARVYLLQTVALGQRMDEAHYYLGRMAEDDNNAQDAIAYYMQVGIGPEYLAATSRVGVLLVKQGQLDRSESWFREQRGKFPQLREQLYVLESDILTRADATQRAMRLLNEALTEMPESPALLYARAMLGEQMDDLALMEKDLRKIIAADPDNTTALNALGYTLADRTARYKEAKALITRALELQPDEPAILDSMGWVLFRTGQYDESVMYLRRAYADFPDPEVAAHLGEVLWVQGDTDGAMAVWQAALARDPANSVVLDTIQRLGVDLAPAMPVEVSPAEKAP